MVHSIIKMCLVAQIEDSSLSWLEFQCCSKNAMWVRYDMEFQVKRVLNIYGICHIIEKRSLF